MDVQISKDAKSHKVDLAGNYSSNHRQVTKNDEETIEQQVWKPSKVDSLGNQEEEL